MRSASIVFSVALGAALWLAPLAIAQRHAGMVPAPRYDTTTEVTVHGTVQQVTTDEHMGPRNMGLGTHVVIKTGEQGVEVHLGPAWFLAEQKFVVGTGDTLDVVGSRVTVSGTPAIIAREVRKGGRTIILRDRQGLPKWSRATADVPVR